jgi:hypothetical protein
MRRDDLIVPVQNQLRARARIIGLDHPDDIHIFCDGADPPNILYVGVGSKVRGSLGQIEELLRESDSQDDFDRLAADRGLCS